MSVHSKVRSIILGLAAFQAVTGLSILLTKDTFWVPLANWIKTLRQDQIEAYISLWGRALLIVSLLLFFLVTLEVFLRRGPKP